MKSIQEEIHMDLSIQMAAEFIDESSALEAPLFGGSATLILNGDDEEEGELGEDAFGEEDDFEEDELAEDEFLDDEEDEAFGDTDDEEAEEEEEDDDEL